MAGLSTHERSAAVASFQALRCPSGSVGARNNKDITMRDGRTLTPQARASSAFMTFATNTLQVVKGRTLPQQYQFTHPISRPEIGDYVAWRKSKDLIQYGLLTSLSPYTAALLDTSISSRRTSRTKTNAPYETFIATTDTINPPGVPIVVAKDVDNNRYAWGVYGIGRGYKGLVGRVGFCAADSPTADAGV